MRSQLLAFAGVIALGFASAQGVYITVDTSPIVNTDFRTYTNGSNYPAGGQTIDFAGVPMKLALSAGVPGTLGIAQIPVTNVNTVFSVPVSIFGAQRLYSLVNAVRGVVGADNGTVEVFGAGGSYAVLHFVQGFNIRDHFNGGYNNSISDPTTIATTYSGGVRLDRQVLELPSSFLADTVNEVRFSGVGRRPEGAALLVGLTFEVVPSPGAVGLLGAAALVALARRR